jgi:hypothetical protein
MALSAALLTGTAGEQVRDFVDDQHAWRSVREHIDRDVLELIESGGRPQVPVERARDLAIETADHRHRRLLRRDD